MELKNNLPEQEKLFLEMSECLPSLYFPISFEDGDIHQLAIDEFCRVRGIICREYKFDEDKYMEENGGTSPFDFVRDNIEQEVYARIRKDDNLLHLVAIRKETIRTIREAVEKENNIIGTFYRNRGEHFWIGEIAEEYENSPIVVTQNKEYYTYGGYDVNTVYELFINSKGVLFCILNGEAGENFDEPIEHVQIEGLIDIQHWLEEYGFISKNCNSRIDMNYLCKCNNCDTILIDRNPQVNAPKLPLQGNEEQMKWLKDEDGEFWGCPHCKTDGYLIDLSQE